MTYTPLSSSIRHFRRQSLTPPCYFLRSSLPWLQSTSQPPSMPCLHGKCKCTASSTGWWAEGIDVVDRGGQGSSCVCKGSRVVHQYVTSSLCNDLEPKRIGSVPSPEK